METDKNSVDSLDTLQAPTVWDVIDRARTVWALLDVEVKQGWENCACSIVGLYLDCTRAHLQHLQSQHWSIILAMVCEVTFARK